MKKVIALVISMFVSTAMLIAQDTLTVEPLGQGEFLNQVIENDAHAHSVYKLRRGAVYYVNGPITTVGYALNLVGETSPKDTLPAVIRPMILPDGTIPASSFNVSGDMTLKNLYVMSVGPLGQQQQQYAAQVYTDSVTVIVDDCIFEGNNEFGIRVFGKYPTIHLTNSIFRNCMNIGSYYNGRMLWTDQPSEEIIIENNTMLNSVAYCLVDRGSKFVKINHNTLVNILGTPFFMHQMYNSEFTNNILYNCDFLGQQDAQITGNWDDSDNQPAAIFSVDTLSATVDSMWNADVPGGPFTEADRKLIVKNNAYFWKKDFVDFWNSRNDLHGGYFMNPRTEAMFNDDVNYPNLIAENNVNVEPNFTRRPDTEDEQLVQCHAFRDTANAPNNVYWGYGGTMGTLNWPLPEDLSYDNTSLLTAGTDGLPLGDLNWFPNVSGVAANPKAMPAEFKLLQNYPNPFNPSTNIRFSLNRPVKVTLGIYDVTGQMVKKILNNVNKGMGSYSINVDMGNLPSGVYIYVLQIGNKKLAKKMMLLK